MSKRRVGIEIDSDAKTDGVDNMLRKLAELDLAAKKFAGTASKFGLMGLGIQTGLLAASLVAVNLAFKAGTQLVRAYRYGLTGLAGAAAGAAAALSAAAAAQREYFAATNAVNYKASALGSRQKTAMGGLRQFQTDKNLASMGPVAVNQAFAAVSKSAPVTGDMAKSMKSLGDFAVASGNLQDGITAAGDFLGQLRAKGKLTQEVIAAGEKLGPQFQEAIKKARETGAVTEDAFLSALNAGKLNEKVVGLLEGVNDTLWGQMKGFVTESLGFITDVGQNFLPDAKKGFSDLTDTMNVAMLRIGATLRTFDFGNFLGGVNTAASKATNYLVDLFEKYLPKTEGFFKKTEGWFYKSRNWINGFIDRIRPLQEGGQVIIDTFKPIFGQLFGGFGNSLYEFNKLVIDNRDSFIDFGDSITNLFKKLGELGKVIREAFVKSLPLISKVVDNIASLIEKLAQFLGMLPGPMALVAALFGRGMMSSFLPGMGGGVGGKGKQTQKQLDRQLARDAQSNPGLFGGFAGRGQGNTQNPNKKFGLGGRYDRSLGKAAPALLMAGAMFGPEEAAAPMMIGSLIASTGFKFAPQAGIAAAGLGTAFNAKTPMEGLVAGGIGGASAGAMIGSVIPGVGTVIGGIAGLIVGSIAGAIKGAFGERDEDKKEVADAATSWTNSLRSGVLNSIKAMDSPEAMREQFGKAQALFDRMLGEREKITKEYDRLAGFGADNDQIYNSKTFQDQLRSSKDELLRISDDLVASGIWTREQAATAKNEMFDFMDEAGGGSNWQEFDDIFMKKFNSFFAQTEGPMKDLNAVINSMSAVSNKNADSIARMTNKSVPEIQALAKQMGVNLYDQTLNLADAMQKLGIEIPQTMDAFNAAFRGAYLTSVQSLFDEIFAPDIAQEAINQAGEQIRNTQGALSNEQVRTFMKTAAEQAAALFPEDPYGMIKFLQENFMPGGKQFRDPQGPLYGREQQFAAEGGFGYIEQVIGAGKKALVDQAALQVQNFIQARSGGNAGIDLNQITNFLASMSPEQINQIVNSAMFGAATVASDQATKDAAAAAAGNNELATNAATTALTQLGIDPAQLTGAIVTGSDAARASLTDDQRRLYDELQRSVQSGFAQIPDWYTNAPAWWNTGIDISVNGQQVAITPKTGGRDLPYPAADMRPPPTAGVNPNDPNPPVTPSDTTSSRLAATMARHAQMNSMIAGKRTVTSSLRSWSLGSINSDHLTGNAYDLTGQNLGAYQQLVRGQGGFAEFHSAGGRHLHVVPGPGVPAGDSATPAMSGIAVAYGASSNPTYNITVNGANASPEQIAMAVMARIEAKERSQRERS